MRTTLTLDSDVTALLREEAHRTRRSFKEVVNDAIRRGLGSRTTGKGAPRYRVSPHDTALVAGVDRARLNQLVDELAEDGLVEQRAAQRRTATRKRRAS